MRANISETVTATELARNLAVTIDKVRLSRKAISIVKGNQTVAQLLPAKQEGFPVIQLETFLRRLPCLDSKHSHSMAADLKMIRDNASLPDELPWG
ncbi:MAG: hypothetical protein KBD83_05515 [Gammaproteobacteria bacterium]|nr:hypothetical protein [Gammaproteobacteria bacterium]